MHIVDKTQIPDLNKDPDTNFTGVVNFAKSFLIVRSEVDPRQSSYLFITLENKRNTGC